MAYDFNSLTKQADEASNRDKFYTDFGDVDPNKLHQISELTDWMRTKAKGSDVREIIAQLFERTWLENIKEGNANMEVAKARGTAATLGDRLDRMTSDIDGKASAKWVEKSLNNILSTTPKASLASLEEIQSTYPNGANGIVVARDSGKWYFWSDASKSWTEGGTYQARIIGENEVTADNVDFVQGIQQMLVQKVTGSVWQWNGEITTFAGADWARYMPIHLLKGKTYYIHNARGYFSHVVSIDGTRRIKQLSTEDGRVSTEYTATEDSLLYVSTNVTEDGEAPKVFNASIAELKTAQVDFDNLPDGYVTLSIPKLTLNVKPEELSFANVVKQLVDESTFTPGAYWTGSGDEKKPADTWGTYPKLYVQAGKTYGLKNVRGFFTHYFDVSGNKIKTFAAKDVLISQDFIPEANGYLLITRQLIDPQSKVIQGGIDQADCLENLDYGSSAIASKVPFVSPSNVKPENLSFANVIKQLLDERTFTPGKFWTGGGEAHDADTWGIYSKIDMKAGVTYGLKNIRGLLTHYFDVSGDKIKTFATEDVLVSQDFTPDVDGYILITRMISDEPTKVIQGGISLAHYLENLDYGSSAIASKVPFITLASVQFGSDITGIDTTQVTTIDNLGYMTPIKKWDKRRGFIDTINVYVKNAGTYNFAIGNIDQNGLIVSPRTFQKWLSAGYNTLDVRGEEHEIFYGEQLFFESQDNCVYASKGERNLIQDAQHTTSNDGYSGEIMYETPHAIPFSYHVSSESTDKKVETLEEKTDKIESSVADFEIFKRTPMVVSPNGTKFRLLVDNNGNLSTVSNIPSRVVVFGNSILSHGWLQGIGMAASSKDKDYFTLVKNYILSKNPSAVVERGNGAAWESDPNNRRQTFENQMKLSLKPDTDIVILQFGDNLNTDEKRKNLETDIPNLVSWIRNASPKAIIYWVGMHYGSQDFVDRIKRICKPLDVPFVDIYQFSKDPKYKSHVGAIIDLPDGTKYTVTDPGVASHPGDLGHKAIADEIIKNFLF